MTVSTPVTQGLFISFEGIDGAGKSTHIARLAETFKAQGRTVALTREPGGTALAEKLREMVLNDAMDPLTESLLVFAARRDHLLNVIEPALARGEVVLCDRFTDATFAYQGGGRGFDLATLGALEQWVQATPAMAGQGIRQPDLTVMFNVSPEVAAARLADARSPDRFEAQPTDFFRAVVAGYAARALAQPQRFAHINSEQTREAVWAALLAPLQQRGWLAANNDNAA